MMKIEKNYLGYFEVQPKPTQSFLAKYYENKYFENKIKLNRAYTEDEMYNKSLGPKEAFHLINQDKGSMIDIGCGEGYFINFFHQRGWSASGVDFSNDGISEVFPELIDKVHIGDIYLHIDELIAREVKFNFVSINHVLEHVINPLEILEKLKYLLEPNGILRISAPNDFSPLQQYLLRDKFVAEEYWVCYPDHLNYFNVASFSNILHETGYVIDHMLAEFPIEIFLLNNHSNYHHRKETGKEAHLARVRFENYLEKESIDSLINFRRGCASANIGRSLTAYCRLTK